MVCLGQRVYVVKKYFAKYFLHTAKVSFGIAHNKTDVHLNSAKSWRVTLIDTGSQTQTGGSLKRVRDYSGEETFA